MLGGQAGVWQNFAGYVEGKKSWTRKKGRMVKVSGKLIKVAGKERH